jgi:hypothetical protein
MIRLYDDRGVTVDYFESLLEQNQNIGVMFSGGCDSTFVIYWLAHCIDSLNLHETHSILPICGINLNFPYDNQKELSEINFIIRNMFPKVTILDNYKFEYYKDLDISERKMHWHLPHRKKLTDSGIVDITITGKTSGPLFEKKNFGFITKTRSPELFIKIKEENLVDDAGHLLDHSGPFYNVDKKFIAYQYHKFNLMKNLYPLTRSCVTPLGNTGRACKTCDWCKEKYWAFSTYDRGLT